MLNKFKSWFQDKRLALMVKLLIALDSLAGLLKKASEGLDFQIRKAIIDEPLGTLEEEFDPFGLL